MAYTVKELAQLSGVSVRTLHYYDEIGLLHPAYYGDNGYRYYEEEQLFTLQQILFFRELDFSLSDIQELLTSDMFNQLEALQSHKKLLATQVSRLQKLMSTIDKTIDHLRGESTMQHDEMYQGFDPKKQAQYEQELKERYGKEASDLIEESNRNIKSWNKPDWDEVKAFAEEINKELTALIGGHSPETPEVQRVIQKHFDWVKRFYTPTKEVYSGLGQLYVDHPDFRKLYDAHHPQLAEFLRDAMAYYAENQL
ncbi:MerR family transcriptional regulator [Brevibacillus dissolubilis]|uniref:MerR family transcriptional regulator n=1 Tax=Brevibacillus dissolubilis TaxID=1844116 RepID=UPI001115D08B|nr:MerR family transcriptional regulator [Brevibacillus dissolubilis]